MVEYAFKFRQQGELKEALKTLCLLSFESPPPPLHSAVLYRLHSDWWMNKYRFLKRLEILLSQMQM